MLKKVLIVSPKEVVLYFTNRDPFYIHSSENDAYQMYLWMFTPTLGKLTLHEFKSALSNAGEETCLSKQA